MKGKTGILLPAFLFLALVLAGCGSSPPKDPPKDPPVIPKYGIEITSNGTYRIDFSELTWEKVETSIAEHMSDMAPYAGYENNPYAMKVEEKVTVPDLSRISGGGLYIESVADPDSDLMVINFTWRSGEEEIVETFTAGSSDEEQQRIVQYKGHEVIAKSPDTGFGWGGYADNATEETNPIAMDGHYGGRIQFYQGGNKPGSYIYSVFHDGSGNPIQSIQNMNEGHLSITLNTQYGGANYPELIRLLVQDNNGDWYLSVGGTARSMQAM